MYHLLKPKARSSILVLSFDPRPRQRALLMYQQHHDANASKKAPTQAES